MTLTSRAKTLVDVRKDYYSRAFFWGLGLAFLIFIPWIIHNDGYFFFYGDFNVQQIPFYQMIHDSVQTGNIGWSYTTDLGANIIGSYSFYMIGSPFFWFTLLFPSAAVPYMIAPMLMVKFALCSLGAYTFLRRYVKNQSYAVIGGLIYAFSGFGVYNIFFNHFHEAMITFPFLLAAVDSFIYEKRKGAVAIAVFAAAFVNYYFFAGQAVFIFIYWCIRMITGSYRMKPMEFLRFAFEILIGFLSAAVVLIPSVFAVLQNSRVSNFPDGYDAIVYTDEQRYMHIIECFFFPPDMPAYANFTPDSNAKWASVAGWLPLFSMVGVMSFFKLKTHKWLRVFVPVLYVMAFVPFFNSMFQLFNSTFYTRWFYMLTLMLALMTIISLDNTETDFKPGLKLTFAVTVTIMALIGFMPKDSKADKLELGLEKYPDRFWIWVALSLVSLTLFAILLVFRKKQKIFIRSVSIGLSAIVVLYANVLVGTGVVNSNYTKDYIKPYAIGNKDKFTELEDLHCVRSDFYEEMDNVGMYWQIPNIQAFQSIVPGSVMEFYKSVGVERTVGSRPETDVYGIRSLLSVKYLFDNDSDGKSFETSMTDMKMPGWKYIETKNGYKVYQNEYFIPYGFTYDSYVTRDEYDDTAEDDRSLLMLKDIVLTPEQAEKYGDILDHDEGYEDYRFTQNEYYSDCKARAMMTCSSIKFENNKFSAEITTGNKDELVVFTIPYEGGWSAKVNGKSADIEKVNVGFMAVRVPANMTSEIEFDYTTPGLAAGAVLSGISVVIFAIYMVFWKAPKRKREDGLFLIDDESPESDLDIYANELFSAETKEKRVRSLKRKRVARQDDEVVMITTDSPEEEKDAPLDIEIKDDSEKA